MTDKVQKIRKEVERLKSNLIHGACSSQVTMETRCKEEAYNEVLAILDTMQEEPVSDSLEKAATKYAQDKYMPVQTSQAFKAGAQWQKQQDSIPSKDLAELIDTLSKRYPEVSFAKLSRIAVRVAKWQKKQDQSTIELAEDHAMLAGMEKMKEEMMEKAVIMEAHEEYGELWGDIRRCNTEKGKRYKVIIIKED